MSDLPLEPTPLDETWPARKQLVLRQANIVAGELQLAARAARAARTPVVWRPAWFTVAVRSTARALTLRAFAATYVVVAMVPSIACVVYFGWIASSQYISEAKFALHSGEKLSLDSLFGLAGAGLLQQVQNSLIVADYMKSRAIVEALEQRVGLRAMFARPEIDRLSRIAPNASFEKLSSYWRWKVRTAIESPSGIITVEVAAFTPEDSLKIAQAVVSLSEELANGLSRRSRDDLVAQSKSELKAAEERVRTTEESLRQLRNSEGIIDPRKQAEGIGRIIEQLRLEQIRLEAQLGSDRTSLNNDAPQIQLLRTEIKAMEDEIGKLRRLLTDPAAKESATISSAMPKFDQLALNRELAVSQYRSAATAYERARTDADRQEVYLDTFVAPVIAQESLYPHRFWFSAAGVVLSHMAWLFVLAVVTALRRRLRK
jgi:capsular polysaccharide transport system permease protein